MSYTFWDTVRGAELADTLIRHLPKLTAGIEKSDELLSEVKALRKDIEEIKEKLNEKV